MIFYVVSDNGIPDSTNTYTKRNTHFNGFIFFTNLDGSFINGWRYKDGKITSQSSTKSASKKMSKRINMSDAVSLMAPMEPGPVDCSTYTIVYEERYCVGDYCTSWTYVGEDSFTYCTGGGGGGTGGGGGGIQYTEYDEPAQDPDLDDSWDALISDSLTHDCLNTIWNNIKNLSTGKVSDIITKFSGTTPGYNWKIKEGVLPANHWGDTDPVYSDGYITSTFDYNKLKNATDLAVAVTILHESIHAYLTAFFKNDGILANKTYPEMLDEWIKEKHPDLNQVQHNQMVISFKQDISDALKEYGEARGYKISNEVYDDIAWSGLQNTSAYSHLFEDDQIRIQNRLSAELTNSFYSDESPTGIKSCK